MHFSASNRKKQQWKSSTSPLGIWRLLGLMLLLARCCQMQLLFNQLKDFPISQSSLKRPISSFGSSFSLNKNHLHSHHQPPHHQPQHQHQQQQQQHHHAAHSQQQNHLNQHPLPSVH